MMYDDPLHRFGYFYQERVGLLTDILYDSIEVSALSILRTRFQPIKEKEMIHTYEVEMEIEDLTEYGLEIAKFVTS